MLSTKPPHRIIQVMAKKKTMNPASLTTIQLAQILTGFSGNPVGVMQIERDLREGAPTNDDGTIHLVHYTAWLVRMVSDVE